MKKFMLSLLGGSLIAASVATAPATAKGPLINLPGRPKVNAFRLYLLIKVAILKLAILF